MKSSYTIGELVKELNINRETIRYYEKIGLLTEAKREGNGYRIYSKEDLDKIRFILMVKNYGFSLKEIKVILDKIYDEILGGNINSIKKIVDGKINELEYKIEDLVNTKKLLEKINKDVLSEKRECHKRGM